MDDFGLLSEYSARGSQAAFRQLVERHVDLVYSAARRQLRSPELAEEVTQIVFVELSGGARKIRPDQPLAAWLQVVTRRRAIDALRRESRRQQRELAAGEIAAVDDSASCWANVEPLLDEAIASLEPADRNAVMLRYFENRSLREVGRALGTSEDGAQKRVSRAVDRLREFFGRRGLTTTAAGLAAEISAHAVQAAPTGLAAAILPAAIAVPVVLAPAATASPATQVLMTSAQKILITAGLAAAIGTAWYEHGVITRQARQISTLQSQAATWQSEIRRLLAKVQPPAAATGTPSSRTTGSPTGDGVSPALRVLLSRVSQLKQRLEQDPRPKIPEMRYLTEADWITTAERFPHLETDDDFRHALASLRTAAMNQFFDLMRPALEAYLKASRGQLPSDISELAPYGDPPLDSASLQRYRMIWTGSLSSVPKNEMLVEGNPDLMVDPDNDRVFMFSLTSTNVTDRIGEAAATARTAFRKANNGLNPTDPSQLVPYFTNPDLAKKYLETLHP